MDLESWTKESRKKKVFFVDKERRLDPLFFFFSFLPLLWLSASDFQGVKICPKEFSNWTQKKVFHNQDRLPVPGDNGENVLKKFLCLHPPWPDSCYHLCSPCIGHRSSRGGFKRVTRDPLFFLTCMSLLLLLLVMNHLHACAYFSSCFGNEQA